MRKDKKAVLQLNLKRYKEYKDEIVAWLHMVAEDINQIDNFDEYAEKPKWTLFDGE